MNDFTERRARQRKCRHYLFDGRDAVVPCPGNSQRVGRCMLCMDWVNRGPVIDPIFEWVKIGPGTYMVHCWYQAPDGVVYYNREITSFEFLPFVSLPMDATQVGQINSFYSSSGY